jgi:RNA polymerase sigma-70 factor (ECF subfamily)
MNDAADKLAEQVLILRCQLGDADALAELIAHYSPGLLFYLRKLAASAAEDLLQDTWFDVYRRINALHEPAAFTTWLYRIARDKAYRRLRRKPEAFLDQELAAGLAAQEEAFTAEDAAGVRAALEDLPSEQREVLVLRFIEEMSYEQIAQIIARPMGTVRSRIHYARLALRERLRGKII